MARLEQNLTHIAARLPSAATAALLQTGKDVLAISQQLVPVDTGALKASGAVDVISSSEVHVGYGQGLPLWYDLSYANFQEYGTSQMPAQPYLTPAAVRAQNIMGQRMTEEINKIT